MSDDLKIGYLLPTRERIMGDVHDARPIVELARHAEEIGFDSVWVGDSITAKPRHDALSMLAAIAAVTHRVAVGTAVELPMLRHPVPFAHQVATVDQIAEGRLILGVGSARSTPATEHEMRSVGVPYEKRVGRMLEGLRLAKALWTGEAVDWDGLWKLEQARIAPKSWAPGGPPIWGGGGVEGALKRTGRYFDGFFPSGPSDATVYGDNLKAVRAHAADAGRDPSAIAAAAYVTVSIDDDAAKAEAALDAYLEAYYGQPAANLRRVQAAFAGSEAATADWLAGFVAAGCRHLCVRAVGDDRAQMARIMAMRARL